MPFRVRLGLGICLVATSIFVSLFAFRTTETSHSDRQYEIVKEVISQSGFERMKPVHRDMLEEIVQVHKKAGRPIYSACWDTAGADPETIDAFNQAIQLGQTISNEFQLGNRWSSTTLSGGGLGQGDPVTITVSFVPDGTTISGGTGGTAPSDLFAWMNGLYGSPGVWQQIFVDEFLRWSGITGIKYVLEPNDDGASFPGSPGAAGVRGDIRIGAKFIDGPSSILAYNYFPNTGDMVLDSADTFFSNMTNNSRKLRNVIAHENGHGIGLAHVCPVDQTKLMEPTASTAFLGPQYDDRLGGQRHYGDVYEPNNSVGAASPLGALTIGTTTITDVSTDDNSDTDTYSFTVPSSRSLTAILRPVGSTYNQGTQSGGCGAGTPFNSLVVSDLSLQVIDSDGTTILGTANVNSAGQNEVLSGISLPTGGTYYVRVTPDSTNSIQSYELDIDLSTATSNAVVIEFPEGLPTTITPDYVTRVRIDTQNSSTAPDPNNSFLYARINGGPFVQTPLVDLGNSIWWANLPAAPCYAQVDYYFEMLPSGGGASTLSPPLAPAALHSTTVIHPNSTTVFSDDFESDLGWTVLTQASVTGGIWERAIPSGDGTRGDPLTDFDNSGNCFVTENGAGNTDVDGGNTRLISPVIDLSGLSAARVSYAFWYSNDVGANPNEDIFEVWVRQSAGHPWIAVEMYNNNAGAWVQREFEVSDFIPLTSTFQIRFVAQDVGAGGSIVEAGIDSVMIEGCPIDNPIGPCAAGSVGVTNGPPAPTLVINGTTGGANREVFVPVNTPYSVLMDNPPGFSGAGYAMFARIGKPTPSEAFLISPQAGEMCFLPAILAPTDPSLFTVAWVAPNPPLGVLDPTATPTPWFSQSPGLGFPLTVSVQAVILEGPILRVSNMVILTIF